MFCCKPSHHVEVAPATHIKTEAAWAFVLWLLFCFCYYHDKERGGSICAQQEERIHAEWTINP